MQELPLFSVKTRMEVKDYRNFLYFAAFRKNIFTIPMIFIISGLGAFLGRYLIETFNLQSFFLSWICILAIMVSILCYKVEWKKKRRVQTDRTGSFGSYETISFYSDYLVSQSPNVEGSSKLRYDQFYRIYSSRSYLILYYNETMASLVRKKDMDKETCKGVEKLLKEQFGKRFQPI